MDFQALVNRLELEAQSLRETIAVSHHRLLEIDTFLKLGRKLTGQGDSDTSFADLIGVGSAATQRDRILDTAEKLLGDGRRRATRDLLAEMKNEFGVSPGGADPVQNLSTYLSRDKRFSSDVKRGGWTLTSLETNARPAAQEFAVSPAGIAR